MSMSSTSQYIQTDKEEWRPVVGYETIYEVSQMGRVRSLDRVIVCSNGINRPIKGKLIKPTKGRTGKYSSVGLNKNGKVKRFYVHRLVAQHFIRNSQNKPCVNHVDGNKLNNAAKNLEWCTYLENTHHAIATGAIKTGRGNKKNKLKDSDVVWIRGVYKNKVLNQHQIADYLKISQQLVSNVVTRKTYAFVGDGCSARKTQETNGTKFVPNI